MQVALVVGASGGVGQEIVRELLSADSPAVTVRAFVRDPAKAAALWSGADAGGGRLQLVKGDVTQPETIAAAVKGADVVILTHSRRLGEAGATAEAVDYGGTCAVCKAAAEERVSRMVYVSSNSVNRPDKTIVCALNWMGGMGLAWKLRAEAAVRNSGVPYVIVRPVGLKDGDVSAAPPPPPTIMQREFGLGTVSRAAVGRLVVRALAEAPPNTTLHCGATPATAAGGAAQDLGAALASLVPDSERAVASASFEQHEAATNAFAWRVRLAGLGALSLAVACAWKARG